MILQSVQEVHNQFPDVDHLRLECVGDRIEARLEGSELVGESVGCLCARSKDVLRSECQNPTIDEVIALTSRFQMNAPFNQLGS